MGCGPVGLGEDRDPWSETWGDADGESAAGGDHHALEDTARRVGAVARRQPAAREGRRHPDERNDLRRAGERARLGTARRGRLRANGDDRLGCRLDLQRYLTTTMSLVTRGGLTAREQFASLTAGNADGRAGF